jgi:hypothetical protein
LCRSFGQYPCLFKLFQSIDDDLAQNISDWDFHEIVWFPEISSEIHHLVGIAQDDVHPFLDSCMPLTFDLAAAPIGYERCQELPFQPISPIQI